MADHERTFRWSRSPIASGRSFPIGLTQLDEALALQPAPSLRDVRLWDWQRYRSPAVYFPAAAIREPPGLDETNFILLASCRWVGIEHGAGAESFTSHLTFPGVDSSRRAEMKVLYVERVLPAALNWIAGIDDGPSTRRTERRRAAFYLRDDEFEFTET